MPIEARFKTSQPLDIVHHNENHPYEKAWEFWRPMYITNAKYSKANPIMVPWTLNKVRQGDIGMMENFMHWMYSTGPRTLKLDPGLINTMYRLCFKKAVPNFLSSAVQTAEEGRVRATWGYLEDAQICASKVGIPWDEEQAENLRRLSVNTDLQRVMVVLDEYSSRPIRDFWDYERLTSLLKTGKRHSQYLGVDMGRRFAFPEHQVTFEKAKWQGKETWNGNSA